MEQELPNPQILPQTQQPVIYGPVSSQDNGGATHANTRSYMKPLVIVFVIVSILVFGAVFFASQKQPQAPRTPAPTPTAVPTPTPLRATAPYATQSAFVAFEKEVTDLPELIQKVNIDDQTIAPPVLDLPLGFSN